MSAVATAIVGGAVVSGYMAKSGAENAADTQAAASDRASQLQYQQFQDTQKLLQPYVTAGQGSLGLGGYAPYIQGGQNAYAQLSNLAGLNGVNAQNQAIDAIQSSPTFLAQIQQGENAMRQNAAATGGLRGGNFQNALMQYRPTLLANNIASQMSTLGGLASTGLNATQNLTQLGQAAAAGVGSAGQNMAANVGNLMGQSAAAQANAQIAAANAYGNIGSSAIKAAGMYYGGTNYNGMNGLPSSYSTEWGTIPGSQQSAMLAAQTYGV